ncbi:MAG: hypothetical protein ABSE73_05405 [Planctomycetota bacterium]
MSSASLRFLFPSLLISLAASGRVLSAETLVELENFPADADPAEKEFLQKKKEARQKVLDERKKLYEDYLKIVSDLQAARQKAAELGTASVTIDEETKPVQEPATIEAALGLKQPVRDLYEVSPDDFSIYEHDRWSLNLSDFHIDAPQYLSTDTAWGSSRAWFVFTYTVTNSTPKKRRISPMFTAVTNKGVFNNSVGGFAPERLMADAVQRPLAGSDTPRDKELIKQGVAPLEPDAHLALYAFDPEKGTEVLQPMSTFEPGQTRWGAALWTNFSNEFTVLKILVHGLNNAHRYDEKMRRVLVLTFTREADEFHVYRKELKLRDRRWDYLWMWDQSITVPTPADAKEAQIKVLALKTPAGADKLMCAFPFVITNSTRSAQEIAINSIAYVCPVEVDVGGAKVNVEARIVDDGRSTIYKAQALKELKKDSPKDRFALNKTVTEGSKTDLERRKTTIEAGKALEELYAVFDEADVDWDNVNLQVEAALTAKVDKKAAAKQTWEQLVKAVAPDKAELLQKDPGFLYDPRRRLTEDEIKQVHEQVAKGLAGALDAAKLKKTVLAYFDCTSGLSTGSYRVSRCYRQPGVVQEEWLKAWEEFDKAAAGGQ